MKYTTYILLSKLKNKTYVGHTNNLENRIKEHNAGESRYTSRFKPWELLHKDIYDTENESIVREKYLKTSAGRRWMKKKLFGR